jgi:transposase
VPLQQGLRNLQTAFTNFFSGRAKYPNFKKKHNGGNTEFTKSAFKWKDGKVFLAKCSQPSRKMDMRNKIAKQPPQNVGLVGIVIYFRDKQLPC